VIFAFESPYIFCGIPDPLRRVPAADGATVKADFDLPPGTSARVECALERSEDWQVLWHSAGRTGRVSCEADFTPLAEGQFRLRLRFVLEGAGAKLQNFETRLWFMVSPHSLPALRNAGPNRMRLHCGDKYGLNTRPILIEQRTDNKVSEFKPFATVNLRHEPDSFARLLPVDASRPWQVIYELTAPYGGRMAWVSAFTFIEGRKPDEPDDGCPARIEIADSPDGPWKVIAEQPIVPHPKGWHFGLFGEGRFSGGCDRGYVRFSAKKGSLGFRIAGHYVPAEPGPVSPLEVEHVWYEDDPRVGLRERRYVERITSLSHEYTVHCQYEPHDERITLRVPSMKR